MPNALIHESSPYLRQHADDPVQWYPWSEEAFEKARREEKLVFLSSGYFTCHWCHVLQHESFQDEAIADALNKRYISIKVDREERPDVDMFYQTANSLMGRSGGWPLSIFMTPDKQIIFTGTYFPPEPRYGMPSFPEVLISVSRTYKQRSSEITETATRLNEAVLRNLGFEREHDSSIEFDKKALIDAADTMMQNADLVHGGFGRQPKFPTTPALAFLIRVLALADSGRKGSIVEFLDLTLRRMANGGIHDHLEGGFHRYSVDDEWNVPHFEKMAYDNAQLAGVYLQFYQITNDPFFKDIGEKILDYTINRLTSDAGGIYSAEDADSEGIEGKFYFWNVRDLQKALESELEQKIAQEYLGIDPSNEENTLRIVKPYKEIAEVVDISENELEEHIETILKNMRQYRDSRERPARDEKILTNLTSLMISAFAYGYRATGQKKYLDSAEKAYNFILSKNIWSPPVLKHVFAESESKIPGFLDDYAYFLKAILDLYSIDPRKSYLDTAEEILDQILDIFWDKENGGFYYVSRHQTDVLARIKNSSDNATPSATAVAIECLIYLAFALNKLTLLDYSKKALEIFYEDAKTLNPLFYGAYFSTLDLYLQRPIEISFQGDPSNPELQSIQDYLRSVYLPWHILAKSPSVKSNFQSDTPHVLICHSFTCSKPLHSLIEFQTALKEVLETSFFAQEAKN
ncbi:MAG: thioredoxin domain-containing protein [Candidatus Heimdallarchaeota archaeon]